MEVLARELLHSNALRRATGAILWGPDISKWSCQWYDAYQLMVAEDFRVNEAMDLHSKSLGSMG